MIKLYHLLGHCLHFHVLIYFYVKFLGTIYKDLFFKIKGQLTYNILVSDLQIHFDVCMHYEMITTMSSYHVTI